MKNNLTNKLLIYSATVALLIVLGLPSRIWPQHFPVWYVEYAADSLWAMMVYFMIAVIFRFSALAVGGAALIFAYLIEISQLFHPPWLESLRSVKLFALVLGHSFAWSDIIAYTLGIALATAINMFILRVVGENECKNA